LVERCRRIDKKRKHIAADFAQSEKLLEDEMNRYFEFWGNMTCEQLEQFRKDPAFKELEKLFLHRVWS